jgi:hypothetical protein
MRNEVKSSERIDASTSIEHRKFMPAHAKTAERNTDDADHAAELQSRHSQAKSVIAAMLDISGWFLGRDISRTVVSVLVISLLGSLFLLDGFGSNSSPDQAGSARTGMPSSPLSGDDDSIDFRDRSNAATRTRIANLYAQLPLHFEPNHGQLDSRVRFVNRGPGHTLFLTNTEAMLSVPIPSANQKHGSGSDDSFSAKSTRAEATHHALRMRFEGANPNPFIMGVNALPGKAHYFTGDDPSRWHTNVPTYSRVEYHDLYPHVDLVYYGSQRQLEYDLVLRPGAELAAIRWTIEGPDRLRLDDRGDVIFQLPHGEVRLRRPVAYQERNGVREPIHIEYAVHDNRIAFIAGDYDASRALIIDPELIYSTFLGGNADERVTGIGVDALGNVYLTGTTTSSDFPTTPGAFNAGGSIFVAKLNPLGTALLYSAFLNGGSGGERRIGSNVIHIGGTSSAIAVDAAGRAFVAGMAGSGFPTTPGAFRTAEAGRGDAFVTQFTADGSALVYSTFLGGSFLDEANNLAIDATGSAYITGRTLSGDFPVTPGVIQPSFAGPPDGLSIAGDGFIAKVNTDGSALSYGTFLGGDLDDRGFGIAVDPAGDAYVTGTTQSSDFPVTAGTVKPNCSGSTAFEPFVTKVDATGAGMYSTCLGPGSGESIAVDVDGNAYITGRTPSASFPTTAESAQPVFGGGNGDAFVTKLNSHGSALLYSTFLGGSGDDAATGIVIDDIGRAYITGDTTSTNFPTTSAAFQGNLSGPRDAFLTTLELTGSVLVNSTFLGGSQVETGGDIARDSEGHMYVSGLTRSADFPTTSGAFQVALQGTTDAFIVKMEALAVPPPSTSTTTTSTTTTTTAPPPVHDLVCEFAPQQPDFKIGSFIKVNVVITNAGNVSEGVHATLSGTINYNSAQNLSVPAGGSRTVLFDYAVPVRLEVTLTASCQLTTSGLGDATPANNSQTKTFRTTVL